MSFIKRLLLVNKSAPNKRTLKDHNWLESYFLPNSFSEAPKNKLKIKNYLKIEGSV